MTVVRNIVRALFPLVLVAGTALAQDDRFPFPQVATTGSLPAQGEGWSGQPGASGHPLMQPDAILAAVADFKNCIDGMWPEAARRGISRASFEAHTAGLEPEVKIMSSARMGSTATSSRRSGASRRNTAPSPASGR